MSKTVDRTAIAVVLLIAAAAGFVREFSGDFHWHLAVGDYIIDHFALYRYDVHTITRAGKPMFISSWLGDAALATGWRIGGPVGVYLLRAAALVAMSWLLIADGMRRGSRAATVALLVLCVIAQSLFQFYLRPEVFAFALFALVVWSLGQHRYNQDRRYLGLALFAILIWSNTHGSVGLGLFALGLYCAEQVIRLWLDGPDRDRTELAVMLALPPVAFLVACINPETINLPLAFRITHKLWTSTIGEWLPLTLSGSSVMVKIAAVAVIATTIAALVLRRETAFWALVFVAVMTGFAVEYRRFLTWALLGAVPLVSTNLAIIGRAVAERDNARVWHRLGWGLAAVATAIALFVLFGNRKLHKEVGTDIDRDAPFLPAKACRFIKDEYAPGPVFNSYELGSFLMHCLGRSYPVFIDQRAWSLYPTEFYRRYRAASTSRPLFDALIRQYPVSWAVVRYDPFAILLSADPKHWALLYFDDKVLVYGRVAEPSMALTIQANRYRFLDPSRLVALTELPAKFHRAARAELQRAEARCRDCYRVRLARAALAIATGDNATFERERSQLLAGPETPELAFLSARHAMQRGAYPGAIELFIRFRKLGGDRVVSYVYQARATAAFGRLAAALKLLKRAGTDARTRALVDRERRALIQRYGKPATP